MKIVGLDRFLPILSGSGTLATLRSHDTEMTIFTTNQYINMCSFRMYNNFSDENNGFLIISHPRYSEIGGNPLLKETGVQKWPKDKTLHVAKVTPVYATVDNISAYFNFRDFAYFRYLAIWGIWRADKIFGKLIFMGHCAALLRYTHIFNIIAI